MTFRHCSASRRARLHRRLAAWLLPCLPLLLLASPAKLAAQSSLITVEPVPRLVVKAGAPAQARLRFRLANGYHTNSNTPSDEYLIPLRLTWEAAPLEVAGVDYPQGKLEKYGFSEKPLSVYSGEFDVTTRFLVPAGAPKGPRAIKGKLRYQACTTTTCFPPRTLAVELPLDIQ